MPDDPDSWGLDPGEPTDLSALAEFIAETDVDGYLIDAGGDDSDQRYVSGFDAPDPFVTCYDGEDIALLVSGLEYGRAKSNARATTVRRFAEYDYRDLVEEHGRHGARLRTIAAFLADQGIAAVAVPRDLPIGTGEGLRDQGVTVTVAAEDVVGDIRATKTAAEVRQIQRVQRANEAAMAAAEDLLRTADTVSPDEAAALAEMEAPGGEAPVLVDEEGILTSERVKTAIEATLLEQGCGLDETIVACGPDGAEPHNRGSGPLRANQPIVIDIFPRSKMTGYHADMTRTFVVGEPASDARTFYDVTREAKAAGLAAVEPGVTGEAVDDAVSAVYEEAGYPTIRSDEDAETGFIHGTGHGVGLDVHEGPRLSRGGEALEVGHVVTVEPGLYDPAVGGVRLEDLVVVTDDGYANLTDYPTEFVV